MWQIWVSWPFTDTIKKKLPIGFSICRNYAACVWKFCLPKKVGSNWFRSSRFAVLDLLYIIYRINVSAVSFYINNFVYIRSEIKRHRKKSTKLSDGDGSTRGSIENYQASVRQPWQNIASDSKGLFYEHFFSVFTNRLSFISYHTFDTNNEIRAPNVAIHSTE